MKTSDSHSVYAEEGEGAWDDRKHTHTHKLYLSEGKTNKQGRAMGGTSPREFSVIGEGIAEKMTYE